MLVDIEIDIAIFGKEHVCYLLERKGHCLGGLQPGERSCAGVDWYLIRDAFKEKLAVSWDGYADRYMYG